MCFRNLAWIFEENIFDIVSTLKGFLIFWNLILIFGYGLHLAWEYDCTEKQWWHYQRRNQ